MPEAPRPADAFEDLSFDGDQVFSTQPLSSRPSPVPAGDIVEFGEAAYLAAYPDAAAAVRAGEATSASDHYARTGQSHHLLQSPRYRRALSGGMVEHAGNAALPFRIDTAAVSANGTVFVVGWCDDRTSPLLSVSVVQDGEGWNTRGVARCRRLDVEAHLDAPDHLFGFWAVHRLGCFDGHIRGGQQRGMSLRARMADGRVVEADLQPRLMSDEALRERVLTYFAGLAYLGNPAVESFQQLDTGAGTAMIGLNRAVSSTIARAAHVERFGPGRSRFAASFIVCLFGKVEFFFVQQALFVTGAGVADVEFIYVLNSPELAEALQKEARNAAHIYGLSVTLVTLPGNAGFSAANNAAARHARSDRLVFMNPDVFPRDDGWAVRHAAILAGAPREGTALFGVPLFYDDGSLMHGGMCFEVDQGLLVRPEGITAAGLIRVEHLGKGAPAWSTTYSRPRPVPAVTGAFISADRAWFELLGGFTEDYVFGHYEDADLAMKSLQAGVPTWLQDLPMWHLEGKGSSRRPVHEGGSMVNRWVFTRRWGGLIEASLSGRTPVHPLLNGTPGHVARARRPNRRAGS
jgi:GT2 family glycosyltransferase